MKETTQTQERTKRVCTNTALQSCVSWSYPTMGTRQDLPPLIHLKRNSCESSNDMPWGTSHSTIGYRFYPPSDTNPDSNDGVNVPDFEQGVFGCCFGAYVGVPCCLTMSCICCYGNAHSQALGWVNPKLEPMARSAWRSALISAFFNSLSGEGHNRNVVAETVAAGFQFDSALKYLTVRNLFVDLMYGVWRLENGQAVLRENPNPNEFYNFCLECCCSGCLRCQEVEAAMVFRERVNRKPLRFTNPLSCQCKIEEEIEPGVWGHPRPLPVDQQMTVQNPKLFTRPSRMFAVPAPRNETMKRSQGKSDAEKPLLPKD